MKLENIQNEVRNKPVDDAICKKIWAFCCKSGLVEKYDTEMESKVFENIGQEKRNAYISWRGSFEAEMLKPINGAAEIITKDTEQEIEKRKHDAKFMLVSLSDVEEKAVSWFIPEYMPANQITMLCGDGGTGKTFVWSAIVAAISNGKYPELLSDSPFGVNESRCGVLYFSSEDSTTYVLKERLRKMGANMDQIKTITLENDAFSEIKFNSDMLEKIIENNKPVLCVFDPVQSFIPQELKMSERNAMRQCLSPLIGLGERFGTTFLIVCHTNKRHDAWGRNRMADSADLWDIARSVLICGRTGKDDERYLSHEKSSYGAEGKTILFQITDQGIKRTGETDKKDRDFVQGMNSARNNAPARDEAKDFILSELRHEGKPIKIGDIVERGKDYGISAATINRAKKDLKEAGEIVLERVGKEGQKGIEWYMKLKEIKTFNWDDEIEYDGDKEKKR